MGSIKNLFSQDSAFFFYTDKLAKLIMLNLMVIVFSLPVFTLGAAFTALYTVMLKLHADEEGGVVKEFWKAFQDNFKQATGIWMCFFCIGAFLFLDYWLLRTGVLPGANALQWPIYIIAVIALCSMMWSFILQSRYKNKVFATMRNGFAFCFVFLPATFMMLLAAVVPAFLLVISLHLMPIVLACGISGSALLQTMLFSQVFKRLDVMNKDNQETENNVPEGM